MGPLSGVRVIEVAGIGPSPFTAMMLADMGADVLRVDRPGGARGPALDTILRRNRRSVVVDLKRPEGVAALLALVERADALIEGFRPGVAERLGFGPDVCAARNRRLVFGRMTGWGQTGPLADSAGHDINYIALSGALAAIGRRGEAPVPPLNLVADYGGGGMLLAYGVVCALFEASRSGEGQVVDAAMVDGSAALMALTQSMRAVGLWRDERGTNLLDTGAPFYDVYETADGRHVAVGALEPQFYAEMLRLTGVDGAEVGDQADQGGWPRMRERLAEAFRQRTRDEWAKVFEGTDACVAPVLSLAEAPDHPHNRARGTFVDAFGLVQPAPAPRFDRSTVGVTGPPATPGYGGREALRDWGFDDAEADRLLSSGAVRTAAGG